MRIAISGYYGYGNFGDEALLAGLLSQLRSIGAEPLVLSGNPDATAAEHGVPAVHRIKGMPAALRSAGALISGGGGLLQDTTSSRSLGYYLGVLRIARLAGLKTVVYGQSVGPLSSRGRARVRQVLRRIPVAVRDTLSIGLLDGLGIEAALVADPALVLEAAPEQAVDLLLIPRAGYRTFSEALLDAGTEAHSLGLSVGVTAIQPLEDATEVGFLLEGLPQARALQAGTYAQSMAIAAAAGMVMSVRLHGLIFAAAANRPHAGLVYDPKVQGFLERSGGAVFTDPVDRLGLLELVQVPAGADSTRLGELKKSAAYGQNWLERNLLKEST